VLLWRHRVIYNMEIKYISECIDKIKFYEGLVLEEDLFTDTKGNNVSMAFNSRNYFALKIDNPIEVFKGMDTQKKYITDEIYEIFENENIRITSSLLRSTDHFQSSEFFINAFEMVMENDITDSRFRLIMKFADKLRLDHFFDNLLSVYTDISRTNRNAIQVNIDSKEFLVYLSGGYFFVESEDVSEIECFLESCRYILTGMSFVTGRAPGDYAYIFEYESDYKSNYKGYKFDSSFSKQVDNSNYSHVNSNIYNHCQDMEENERNEFIGKYQAEFKGVSKLSFSNLCNNLLTNDGFADGVYSIIEARQSSLIAMGILYSVSLESLSTAVSSNRNVTSHYIKSKDDRKKLRNKLLETARIFFSENLDVSFDESPIKKKIENILSPTNRDKLSGSFETLSIPLLKDDLSIIDKRNDFLHGNKLFQRNGDFDEQLYNLWNIALRLSFLVNAIVLKYIGHTGYISNNAGVFVKEYVDSQKTYRKI
jgi:predicted house-cleaning noncanonical NTP pyrophosphatase (MazG superfamily)